MFTQKENALLQDFKQAEELCIEKYTNYANTASNQKLKNLMNQICCIEKNHLQTINQIIGGQLPSMSGGECKTPTPEVADYTNNSEGFKYDKYICSDALSTEKHVSSTYNTGIFEFKDVSVRNILNHIQKEEQEHGEKIYSYMSMNGMYS